MTRVSIIIRTKNEQKWLASCLESLCQQTVRELEVIGVDSGSTDQTIQIFKSFGERLDVKIYSIDQDRFTYPFACNFGAQKASGDVIGYLSGHSVPIKATYLESGLKHLEDLSVAGIYGPVLPLSDASITERIFYGVVSRANMSTATARPRVVVKPKMGILGNTNSLIRKSLWLKHNFNEILVKGAEDVEWAYYWLRKGKKIIFEPDMVVRHSHGVSFSKFVKQYSHWQDVYRQALNLVEA